MNQAGAQRPHLPELDELVQHAPLPWSGPAPQQHIAARRLDQVLYDLILNANGKPGKLHAKVALVDGQALISSANLTDDAFNRNLELGALLVGQGVAQKVKGYVDGLCAEGVLRKWED